MHHRSEIEVTRDEEAAFWGCRDCEYFATFGSYDLDCAIGYGRTPLDAIVDLLDETSARVTNEPTWIKKLWEGA